MDIDYMTGDIERYQKSCLDCLGKNIDHMFQELHPLEKEVCLEASKKVLELLTTNGYHYKVIGGMIGFFTWTDRDRQLINSTTINCKYSRLSFDSTLSAYKLADISYDLITKSIKNKDTQIIGLFLPVYYSTQLQVIDNKLTSEDGWYSVFDVVDLSKQLRHEYRVTVYQTKNQAVYNNEFYELNFVDALKETKKTMNELYKDGYRENFWSWKIEDLTANKVLVCKGTGRISKEKFAELVEKYGD